MNILTSERMVYVDHDYIDQGEDHEYIDQGEDGVPRS